MQGCLWGVSFDGVVPSGVVTEFLRLADLFSRHGMPVYFDPGFDIKADKGHFFVPYDEVAGRLPAWVTLDRLPGLCDVPGYHAASVARLLQRGVAGTLTLDDQAFIGAASDAVAKRLLAHWRALDVAFVVVENGTLPENVIFTQALWQAIATYGAERRLGQFVLWRDHDWMWSSETTVQRYGAAPYAYAPKPPASPHIRWVCLHDDDRAQLQAWAPQVGDVAVVHNTFTATPRPEADLVAAWRARLGVPSDVFVLARASRIIAPKRLDRDLHLLAGVNRTLQALGVRQQAHLVVAGDPQECAASYAALQELARHLGVAAQTHFVGPLLSHGDASGLTVRDLLAAADVACFLTAYDYDSFGNPIGDAIAAGVPFCATRYARYDAVWGALGVRGPVLDLSPGDDELPDAAFVAQVVSLLVSPALRAEVAAHNLRQARLHGRLDDSALRRLVAEFLRPTLRVSRTYEELPPLLPHTRATVVLPVYNEANELPAALGSLVSQRRRGDRLPPGAYELLVVDNNSTDGSLTLVEAFRAAHPEIPVHILHEPEQGVAPARRAGMHAAARRARERAARFGDARRFYLLSADADCEVASNWLTALVDGLDADGAELGVCRYLYDARHFASRPRLWSVIERTLRVREAAFQVFGGFPDGRGFAVDTQAYLRCGGIAVFYQMQAGRFVGHPSDDWDFGIKLSAHGGRLTYVPTSTVTINPRRVDGALSAVIDGHAYGRGGTVALENTRPDETSSTRDLTCAEALRAWHIAVRDFVPKNLILPLLLHPEAARRPAVGDFLGTTLAEQLAARGADMLQEAGLQHLRAMHAYKTPCSRLYFEFAEPLFAALRRNVGADIGGVPPWPACLRRAAASCQKNALRQSIYWYCEDRESGEAHDYFGNGGIF